MERKYKRHQLLKHVYYHNTFDVAQKRILMEEFMRNEEKERIQILNRLITMCNNHVTRPEYFNFRKSFRRFALEQTRQLS